MDIEMTPHCILRAGEILHYVNCGLKIEHQPSNHLKASLIR
jgi:hypothetical protein